MSGETKRVRDLAPSAGGPDAGRDNPGVIAPPPLIYLGPLLLGVLLHRVAPLPLLPPAWARGLGWPLLAGGVALNGWFIAAMRRGGTPIDPRKPVARLLTGGPFRFSRNPSYSAFALAYAGLACLANTAWPLLALPAVLLTMQRGVIAREERYLDRTFGEEYHHYRARVRRWL